MSPLALSFILTSIPATLGIFVWGLRFFRIEMEGDDPNGRNLADVLRTYPEIRPLLIAAWFCVSFQIGFSWPIAIVTYVLFRSCFAMWREASGPIAFRGAPPGARFEPLMPLAMPDEPPEALSLEALECQTAVAQWSISANRYALARLYKTRDEESAWGTMAGHHYRMLEVATPPEYLHPSSMDLDAWTDESPKN